LVCFGRQFRLQAFRDEDADDPVLGKALAYRSVQALTLQWKRGGIGSEGLRNGVRVWCINFPAAPSTLPRS